MKTIIEAGHFYSVNGPSVISVKGWEIGKDLADKTPNSELAIFIDDFHHEQTFLESGDSFFDETEAQEIAQSMQLEAAHIFSESAIAEVATGKIIELLDQDDVALKKRVVSTKAGNITLGTVDNGDISTFKPRCVFLDYMLLGEKTKLGSQQITVLPETYTKEQTELEIVIGQLTIPNLVSYKSIFHSLDPNNHLVTEEVHV